MAKFPGLPSLSIKVPREISSVLEPMMTIMRTFIGEGNDGDGVVFKRDLKDAGLISDFTNGVVPRPENDFTPPPAPTGLEANGALAAILLEWDRLDYDNIAHVEVWRAQTNDISLAQYIGSSTTTLYSDVIGGGATRFYWIRYVSKARVPGPFNAQLGVSGTTAQDASYLMDVLAANPPPGATYNPLLYVQSSAIVIDGVTIPAGVYMSNAFIRKLSVTNAQLGNLSVDNAKIVSLSAEKITAGFLDAARIQVGSLDVKIANLNAAVIGSGFIDKARINNASMGNVTITSAMIESLTANKIVATSLSAISANLGAVTAGSININGRFIVDSSGNVTIRSALSGARVEQTADCIKVFDAAGTLRVKIGNLAA